MSPIHQHSHQDHDHGHQAGDISVRLVGSILLNFIITLAEIIGGLLSGSIALLSDALHNFSDTTSLVISLVAVRLATRQPDHKKTFGYRRAQIIGAMINLFSLVIIAIYLIREAVERYLNPQPVQGQLMLLVASIGLGANLLTALLLHAQSKHSLNIRSAFLHIVGDSVSSVGVVLGAVLIIRFQIYFIDAVLTILISIYILVHSFQMLRQTINILMQAVPEGIDLEQIMTTIQAIRPVKDIHHLHVWQLDENHTSLEAHIVIHETDANGMSALKQEIKDELGRIFHIHHSTLEFEFQKCYCTDQTDCYEAIRN